MDQQIDALVYELYWLTAEEIAVVEGTQSHCPISITHCGGYLSSCAA